MFEKNFLDNSVMSLLSLTPFYKNGWGDPNILIETRRQFVDLHPTAEIDVKWVNQQPIREGNAWVCEGYFETPVKLPMPPVTRTAWFQQRLPLNYSDYPIPMVLLLAATGDENYAYRTQVAKHLLKEGIGVILLINPFYGKRKPPGQFRSSIRSFSDQILMNFMTLEESRSILKWLQKTHPIVGVAGYSMGGFMAAYTASLYEQPIAAVPAAAGLNAGFTFTQSVMSKVPSWNSLKLKDVEIEPQELFTRSLAPMNLSELPIPKDTDSTILIGNLDDAVVPPEQVQALFDYWQCRELRWLDAGHSTGYLLHIKDIANAISDAISIRIYKAENESC